MKLKLHPINFIGLTVAGIINSIGVCLFLTPLHVYDGGFSGTSVLLSRYLGLAQALFLLILNVPFYFIGRKKIGWEFLIYSLYAIAIYSLGSLIINEVIFTGGFESIGSPIVGREIVLASIFGGLLSGVGSGLVIKFGGALDGVEVMAVIFHKKLGVSVGTFVMVYNAILYVVAAVIASLLSGNNEWTIALYSVIAYYVGLKTIDFIVEGLEKGKAAMIITENPRKLSEALSRELKRGITLWDSTGYYSGADKKMLYVVVNRFEIAKLKMIVGELDPKAFVSIMEVSEIMGTSKMYRKKHKGGANASGRSVQSVQSVQFVHPVQLTLPVEKHVENETEE
ncbi:MAG: YitT family protein [Clostridia bacterium]|nr:YitT family protein [Clostridia bacterium]